MRLLFFKLMLLAPSLASADPYVITRLLNQEAMPNQFEFCHGGGCAAIQRVGLAGPEWVQVMALFVPASTSAAQERDRIARAVALMERLVGTKTGTSRDLGGTFEGFGLSGQLDCIDESTNTTTYLKMMRNNKVLHFHEVADTQTRGYFVYGWPHTAASIRERENGARYVVDSWFYNNGEPPVILPLQEWRDGWTPSSGLSPVKPDGEDTES